MIPVSYITRGTYNRESLRVARILTEVDDEYRRRGSALEAACEAMLTDQRHYGVLVHDYIPVIGASADGQPAVKWTVELSPAVPFKEIYTHRIEGQGESCPLCG